MRMVNVLQISMVYLYCRIKQLLCDIKRFELINLDYVPSMLFGLNAVTKQHRQLTTW